MKRIAAPLVAPLGGHRNLPRAARHRGDSSGAEFDTGAEPCVRRRSCPAPTVTPAGIVISLSQLPDVTATTVPPATAPVAAVLPASTVGVARLRPRHPNPPSDHDRHCCSHRACNRTRYASRHGRGGCDGRDAACRGIYPSGDADNRRCPRSGSGNSAACRHAYCTRTADGDRRATSGTDRAAHACSHRDAATAADRAACTAHADTCTDCCTARTHRYPGPRTNGSTERGLPATDVALVPNVEQLLRCRGSDDGVVLWLARRPARAFPHSSARTRTIKPWSRGRWSSISTRVG